MIKILFILTSAFVIVSCTTNNDKQQNNNFDTLPLPIDSTTFYFKTKVDWKDSIPNTVDSFGNQWFSKQLFALKEPVLSNYQGDKEIYRFTWLRTFHHPVSIRLEKQNNIIKLFSKVSNGAGGYEAERIIFDTTINVSFKEYDSLKQKIDKINFWNLATESKEALGDDGSEWIIEAVSNNKYHMVFRWSPSLETNRNFRIVGEYLISLSKIGKAETKDIY